MCDTPGLTRIAKESYNHPAEVYDRCKRLGMSIVTLTDHDSIEAAEALRKHPDFFLSEEVTVRMPTGTQIHLGVYGITEKDHSEISRRRNDFLSLLMYLTERKIFFSLNHVFSSLTGRRPRPWPSTPLPEHPGARARQDQGFVSVTTGASPFLPCPPRGAAE